MQMNMKTTISLANKEHCTHLCQSFLRLCNYGTLCPQKTVFRGVNASGIRTFRPPAAACWMRKLLQSVLSSLLSSTIAEIHLRRFLWRDIVTLAKVSRRTFWLRLNIIATQYTGCRHRKGSAPSWPKSISTTHTLAKAIFSPSIGLKAWHINFNHS